MKIINDISQEILFEFSANIKERLDFSCALFDQSGGLFLVY